MVEVNFRGPEDVKARAIERAEREGINLTDALRDFLTAWAKSSDDRVWSAAGAEDDLPG